VHDLNQQIDEAIGELTLAMCKEECVYGPCV